ncbi:hypothetical protein K438DRAFT_2085939 [Mycena galopus ATCC 62051]|nr:hypothetical protein K438DRAFT_2085939 [Mycena galopus ATCC 62051]
MSKTAAIPYTDLPLSKKLKTELQAIAIAMGEDEEQSVKDLRKSIQKYLHDHPEAADNPKFLPLFVHRTAPKAGGRNSANKATEDAAQVPAKELTGFRTIGTQVSDVYGSLTFIPSPCGTHLTFNRSNDDNLSEIWFNR